MVVIDDERHRSGRTGRYIVQPVDSIAALPFPVDPTELEAI